VRQSVFGMIFTVNIALEFKRSLLVLAERSNSVVQVCTVIAGARRRLLAGQPHRPRATRQRGNQRRA